APSPSGKAADCKSAIPGSNPGGASFTHPVAISLNESQIHCGFRTCGSLVGGVVLLVSLNPSHLVAPGINRLCKPCANRRQTSIDPGGPESFPVLLRGRVQGQKTGQFLDAPDQVVQPNVHVPRGQGRGGVTGQLLGRPQVNPRPPQRGDVTVPQRV